MPISNLVKNLDRPHVIIDAADPLHFRVEWAEHHGDLSTIDPIVELFRPLRDKIRNEHDVHIVVGSGPWTDKRLPQGRVSRTYVLSFCPGERRQDEVDRATVAKEFKAIQPRLLIDLQNILDTWVEAEDGLTLFLERGNKESIHAFLVRIGLRSPDAGCSKEELKAKRRQAYIAAHPEHAKTARPRKK
ncbi:hypothetical protein IKE71_02920 [Candidatus Saccharibacteria bacterium]|nr:hypothetical protein [Candidatus Saccharibacteria bacterium]